MRTVTREFCLSVVMLAFAPVMTDVFGAGLNDKVFAQTPAEPERFEITVPENRQQKRSRSVSIAAARFTGTHPNAAIPLIYVSGGSGAGIAAATGSRRPFFEALRELGDVVAFDIRGTGRSTPRLSCDASFRLDLSVPLTRAALIDATREVNRTCAATFREQGFDLAGYSGREVVEDIEALRKHLGVNQIRLFGTSTGTHLALEYVRAYPKRVASVFLAGTEGPGQTAHLPGGMDAAVATFTANKPQLLELMKSVFDALDTKPVTVDVKGTTVGIGGYDARVFLASTLGDRAQMGMLEKLFSAMRAGQYPMIAGLKIQALKQPFQSPWESLHDCQAGTADARQQRVEAEAKTALLGFATLDFVESCDGWGVEMLPGRYRAPVTSAVPALFISGTLDGRTPVANAEEVRRGFRNSGHVIIEGASHGDDLFLSTPDILQHVLAFARQPHSQTVRVTAH
jgi:pimeloyl-ACP methyl ester carboxylesterase